MARPAQDTVNAEYGLEPGHVRGRAQAVVDLYGAGERSARLASVVGVDEVPGRRLQCLRLLQGLAGVFMAFCSCQPPGGTVQQAAAVEGVRLPVRDIRFGREGVGLAGQDLTGTQFAGLGGRGRRADPVRR